MGSDTKRPRAMVLELNELHDRYGIFASGMPGKPIGPDTGDGGGDEPDEEEEDEE